MNGIQEVSGSNPLISTKENLEKWLCKAKFQGFFFSSNFEIIPVNASKFLFISNTVSNTFRKEKSRSSKTSFCKKIVCQLKFKKAVGILQEVCYNIYILRKGG